MSEESIKNNHEILFIYDAKMCNPNGDPDDENKPRMDYVSGINLVSDLRLKRYIRDYLMDYKGETIFVSKVDGGVKLPEERLKLLVEREKKKINLKKITEEDKNWLLRKLPDIRLFGAIIPNCTFEKGGNATFTGPVQFNWGYSLNKITGPMESSGITSHFRTGEKKEAGAMGKDYRVDYSLIAFHGIISANRAVLTKLTDKDIELLDEAMIKSIPLMATRSKIGQYPRLYLRIEYNSSEFLIGDLRKYVDRLEDPAIRFIEDYTLNLTRLKETLDGNEERIEKVYWWKDEALKIRGVDFEDGKWLDGKVQKITISEKE